jgi:hypothetical protein
MSKPLGSERTPKIRQWPGTRRVYGRAIRARRDRGWDTRGESLWH